jgi:signal transduction histidine kinase
LISYLPRGNLLDDVAWNKRHRIVWSLLVLHLPALTIFGLLTGHTPKTVGLTMIPVVVSLALERLTRRRRLMSFFTTAGIVYCSAALVGLSNGAIEAHFHFFIIIGFIALYQDWVPFAWNIAFTIVSHGVGSAFRTNLIFDTHAGMEHPWLWSFIHGIAVLAACVGVVLFWRTTEQEQRKSLTLTKELGEADLHRSTSQLLVNLARRNQGMLYRQLDIINQLEDQEQDPDALAELFRLDHLATRIRRNAESFLVLSGEEPARVWSNPVPLFDVVRAAIAETEDLDRVGFMVDERLAVHGHAVTDLTHLLAELTENAVRFSPPGSRVTIRSTADVRSPGAWVLTVEDCGIGMRPEDLIFTNEILSKPRSIDAASSQRLGLHVVARLAHRHSIEVALTSTTMVGLTAVVLLPPALFAQAPRHVADVMSGALGWRGSREGSARAALSSHPAPDRPRPVAVGAAADWGGWWADEADSRLGSSDAGNNAALEAMVAQTMVRELVGQEVGPRAMGARDVGNRDVRTRDVRARDRRVQDVEARDVRVQDVEARDVRVQDVEARDVRVQDVEARDVTGRNAEARNVTGRDVTSREGAGAREVAVSSAPIRLSRREPQASLAPELRRAAKLPARPAALQVPAEDASRARDALSRYQASRNVALAKNTTDGGRSK